MPLTLTVADLATSPTAQTASVAGTAGGEVTVYAQPVDGQIGTGAVTAVGGRTGDGDVPLTLAKGYWWVFARTASDFSPLAYLSVTDGLDSVPTRVRSAVKARLLLLGLPLKAVWEHVTPDDSITLFPCAFLTVGGVREEKRERRALTDYVGYPVQVMFADKAHPGERHQNLPEYERWRYLTDRAFDAQPLPGVDEAVRCVVEPDLIVAPDQGQYEHFASGLTVRCVCRVPRGLGV